MKVALSREACFDYKNYFILPKCSQNRKITRPTSLSSKVPNQLDHASLLVKKTSCGQSCSIIRKGNNFLYQSNRVIMRLSTLLNFLAFQLVHGDSRLNLFFQHHEQRKPSIPLITQNLSNEMRHIQRKLRLLKHTCSSETCSKCEKLLKSGPCRMKKACSIILRMPACCPHSSLHSVGR